MKKMHTVVLFLLLTSIDAEGFFRILKYEESRNSPITIRCDLFLTYCLSKEVP